MSSNKHLTANCISQCWSVPAGCREHSCRGRRQTGRREADPKATAVAPAPVHTQQSRGHQLTVCQHCHLIQAQELCQEGYCHHNISNNWVFCLCWQKCFRGTETLAILSTLRAEDPLQISWDLVSKDWKQKPLLSSWLVSSLLFS